MGQNAGVGKSDNCAKRTQDEGLLHYGKDDTENSYKVLVSYL